MDISNTLEITKDVLKRFLSLPKKHRFEWCLTKSFPPLSLESTTQEIQDFVDIECGRKDIYGNPLIKPGGRHAYFRAIRCFFNWAYSPANCRSMVSNISMAGSPGKADIRLKNKELDKDLRIVYT